MPEIREILQGKRNEIIYDLSWSDYCGLAAMNPSTLVCGIKPKGSLRLLKYCWDCANTPGEDEDQSPPSGPLVWGRAAHCLLFEPDKFIERFCCWDGRRAGNEYKAFAAQAAEFGAEVLNKKQFATVVEAGRAFAQCQEVKPLISSGKAEVTLLTVEEIEDEDGEIHEVQCKHRLDWVDGGAKTIVDLKTTRNMNPRAFSRDFFAYKYAEKLGLYQRALEKLTGERYPVNVVMLEKSPPFDVAIMPVPDEVLERGAKKALGVLREVVTAIKRDKWPGKSHQDFTLDVPAWEMDDEVDYSGVSYG